MKKTTHYKKVLFLWSLLGAILLTLNTTLFGDPMLGIFGLLLYAIPLGFWSSVIIKDYDKDKLFFGILVFLSSIIILCTATYYIYGITKLSSIVILVIPLLSFLFGPDKIERQINIKPKEKINFTSLKLYSVLLFIILEVFFLVYLILNRTTELMPSPWSNVEPWFFILYAIATCLLFYILYKSKSAKLIIPLSGIHLFITFGITPIMYPLGWGFDAYVHRATEMWILNNGFVTPKQPYYIGQYSFVVWLAQLTKIPLFYIDVYLVPLLASIMLPAGIIYSLKHAWKMPKKYSALFVWLIPFVPFLSLHLTTPHNVVLLFSILLVFVNLAYLKDKLSLFIPLILAIATVSTHPLVGAPMFIFTITAIIIKSSKNKKVIISTIALSTLVLAFLLPLMFIVNNLRAGAGFPEFTNPIYKLDHFFSLFTRPYWYAKESPIIFELLYFWQRILASFVVLLGIVGIVAILKKKQNLKIYILYITAPVGFVLSSWLLRSWITFPDVVSYEQGDFPLRLVKASLLFLLPFVAYFLYRVIKIIEKQKREKIYLGIFAVLASVLLMLSFYLSYPQRNPKARFPGLNVTQSDFKAVEWIHNRHSGYDYIVLSNQLVSAAALTNYSFAKYYDTPHGEIFYYSVPTGGLLYKQYGKMLYEGQKREYMIDAMDIAGVDTAYFVINSYWANSQEIINGAKNTANAFLIMDGGKIWIFEYRK
jgi:hypothetical protein